MNITMVESIEGSGGVADALLCRASLLMRDRKTATNPSFGSTIKALSLEYGHPNVKLCQSKLRELLQVAKASAAQERQLLEAGKSLEEVERSRAFRDESFESEYKSPVPTVSLELLGFLSQLLQKNPITRMSADTAMLHPWINNKGELKTINTLDTKISGRFKVRNTKSNYT